MPFETTIDSDGVQPGILEELASTPYACSALEQLRGGTANYTFKGTLVQALPDGTTKIMIKHSRPYSASNNSFELDIGRAATEEACLKLTSTLPAAVSERAVVRTPKLYFYSEETNTQVQEYLEDAIDLKRWAIAHASPAFLEQEAQFYAVGRTIGVWLRDLHAWGMQPEQEGFREKVALNKGMQKLKNLVNYTYLMSAVDTFPDLLTEAKDVFLEVKAMSEEELKDESKLDVIHGDFWTGNITAIPTATDTCVSRISTLLPNVPFQEGVQTPVFVVDWEMCEMAVRPLDLGQFIAELYCLILYRDIKAIQWLINGFAEAYGFVDDAFAFRVAIHTGVHLASLSSRIPGWGTDEQIQTVVRTGRDMIVHAWHKDRAWFEASDLASLFRRG
ncbi:hypothetical protein GQ53DRAFT_839453 [Thozetella sp. PMI_491]|nr:hypothetical protein GQ53DRAFT_839453 [Thozetella sp. PMI_491]